MLEGQKGPKSLHFVELWWFLHCNVWETPKLFQFSHLQKNALFSKTFSLEMDAEWRWIGWTQFISTIRWLFISLFRQKNYKTLCSRSPSTNHSLCCIGREPVHSTRCGRSHWHLKQNWFCIWQHPFRQHRFTHIAFFFYFFRCILIKIFQTADYSICVRSLDQQTTFRVYFLRKLIDGVGKLTYIIGSSQQTL